MISLESKETNLDAPLRRQEVPFDRTAPTELGDDVRSRLQQFAMDCGTLLGDEEALAAHAEAEGISMAEAIKGITTTMREIMVRLTEMTAPFVPVQQILMQFETGKYNVTFRGDTVFSPIDLTGQTTVQVPYILGERPWADTLEGPRGTF